MKVNFVSKLTEKNEILALVTDKKSLSEFKELDKNLLNKINHAVNNENFEFNKFSSIEIINDKNSSFSKVIIISPGKKSLISGNDLAIIGGKINQISSKSKNKKVSILVANEFSNDENFVEIGFGATLNTYKFDKYKSKKKTIKQINEITIISKNAVKLKNKFRQKNSVAEGIFLARDLVNEPSNILNPEEYAKRIKGLSKYGLKVEVLNETKMKKLGMWSLLGVGRGSQYESQLVIMRWDGNKSKKSKPLCFVGKGVCFDSGGISLKPGNKMEEMIGDMGGSAAVVGLMKTLALRKAKVNVVGVVGLVENMPDGTAQKPGDIVKSMSGQTIEIQNTDAEGRLVLADALWYAQDKYKPEIMIDLATLTGAIVMSLGNKMAGIFSNNDDLSDKLLDAGKDSGDNVWRLPLSDSYDKMINSKFADMKNIGLGGAGSITAAQFLKRFVNKVPWVHIDIAGTATGMEKSSINTSWATGFGVNLLNTLISKFYE
jgi:leucyl aminopeptidase